MTPLRVERVANDVLQGAKKEVIEFAEPLAGVISGPLEVSYATLSKGLHHDVAAA